MTKERAQEIFNLCTNNVLNTKGSVSKLIGQNNEIGLVKSSPITWIPQEERCRGPWVDRLDQFMTKEEIDFVNNSPGESFVEAFLAIKNRDSPMFSEEKARRSLEAALQALSPAMQERHYLAAVEIYSVQHTGKSTPSTNYHEEICRIENRLQHMISILKKEELKARNQ